MLFTDKKVQLLLFGLLFIVFIVINKKNCPCNVPDEKLKDVCYRYEVFGIQTNHIYLYMILGYLFPEFLITVHIAGILWELFEMYLDHNEEFATQLFGGCLKEDKTNNKYIVGRGKEKYMNPIDKFFGIKNSKIHGWHGSVAEIIANIIGFEIGRQLYSYKVNSYIFISIISSLFGLEIINTKIKI